MNTARIALDTLRTMLALDTLRTMRKGLRFGFGLPPTVRRSASAESSPLEEYFDSITEGPGILKWRHYFPIYHRHLSRFVATAPHVVEIGVYGGGSLGMWRHYFGPDSRIYGIDIDPDCKAHETEGIEVLIGDQADPEFWERFQPPRIDVVIDDGGHEAHQQITTLRCLLPRMEPGSVYICEDVHHEFHQFNSFVDGLTRTLNLQESAVHHHVASVHRYPFLTVIEKSSGLTEFSAERHGTAWPTHSPYSTER